MDKEKLESKESADGAVSLMWKKDEATVVILEQGEDALFTKSLPRYQGTDEGSVLTGLPEGTHYFRVGEAGSGEWSDTLTVTVKFFPQNRLFQLLGIGCLVVAATIGTIVAGYIKTRKEEGAD